MRDDRFRNRRDAGRALASLLTAYVGRPDVLVLALPRGGVPVGFEVARALKVPLDVVIVRKLGVPGQPELAMGAIASGGLCVLNESVIHSHGITPAAIERVVQSETRELQHRLHAYRGERPEPSIEGRTLILVDDGLATGSTMRAAIAATRIGRPSRIIVAVPVAPAETIDLLRTEADEVACVKTPNDFDAVGRWYVDFTQTTDVEVCDLLALARTA